DSNAARCCFASAIALASEPGSWTVSASVNSSHSPRAALAPVCAALHLPEQPGGSGSAPITRTPGMAAAMARVPSVEASSTTTISWLTPDCASSERRQTPRLASSLRAGTITETSGTSDGDGCGDMCKLNNYKWPGGPWSAGLALVLQQHRACIMNA